MSLCIHWSSNCRVSHSPREIETGLDFLKRPGYAEADYCIFRMANSEILSRSHGGSSSVITGTDAPEHLTPSSENSPGYLGFTSFSAVFQETQNSLSLVKGVAIPSGVRTPSSEIAGSDAASSNLRPRDLETCLTVLRLIPDETKALPLFLKHGNPNDGWIRLAAQRLVESLHSTFGPELRSRTHSDLISMAQVLSFNTARTWLEDEPDAEKWIASLCGRNMRWECLGILFTYCTSLLSNPLVALLRKKTRSNFLDGAEKISRGARNAA